MHFYIFLYGKCYWLALFGNPYISSIPITKYAGPFNEIVRRTSAHYFLELYCYQCSSNKSFEDCIKKQTVVNCPIPERLCYKATIKEGKVKATYRKGCTTTDHCKQTITTTVDCCSDDRCNTSKKIVFTN